MSGDDPASCRSSSGQAHGAGLRADGAEPLRENGQTVDILIRRGGREFLLFGPAGVARELAFLPEAHDFPGPPASGGPAPAQSCLPVVIGAGSGAALELLAERLAARHGPNFHLLIIDREHDIQAASGARERVSPYPGIVWLDDADSATLLKKLTLCQAAAGGLPLYPLLNPFYLRLDRAFYAAAHQACTASAKADFWAKTRYPRFQQDTPRILLLTSGYFLIGEFLAACKRLDYPHRLLQVPEGEMGRNDFIEQLLAAVVEFKPDFALTINHLGIDREGVLIDLLDKLQLPLASWFVDNPHLILYLYARLVSPWTAIFTWDADNLTSLRELGFKHVSYLPLGVDVTRFAPPAGEPHFPGLPPGWDRNLAFVGNSMYHKVLSRKERINLPPALADNYTAVAEGFAASDERSVRRYLEQARPDLVPFFEALPDVESQLGYEAMLTWEATRQYRLGCVRGILPFAPLIAGDDGWKILLANEKNWHYHQELNYYHGLPHFYPCAAINFNCTSQQMKGAVNQRVFDVPATGSFLLTDYREQMENLFEPGREIICYHSPEEATALAAHYLARPEARQAVALAARKRILAEHSYEHRLVTLIRRMRDIFA